MTAKGADPRIEIVSFDRPPIAPLAASKGILFVSGHLGGGHARHAARQFGFDGGAVYRPVNNPYIDRYIVRRSR